MNSEQTPSIAVERVAGVARHRAVVSGVFAVLLGAFLLIGAGLAQPSLLHNGAHDTRHAFAFPCH